jgi:hypothetical protein
MHRLLALALLLPLPAFATTGLAWQWPAEGSRFLMAVQVQTPTALTYPAEKNIALRAAVMEIVAVTSCAPAAEVPKKGFRLECKLEDVALRVDPAYVVEVEHIAPVLAELDERLTGAVVQLTTNAEGHVKSYDLEGLPEGSARQREQFAILRLVMMRMFALLDFELPKGGDDQSAAWRVTGTIVNGYPSELGVAGSFAVDSAVASTDGTVAVIKQRASGIVQSGEQSAVGSGQPTHIWDTTLDGTARFDMASGRLLEREYVVEGLPTGSSLGGTSARPYRQVARLVALGASEHPELPATGTLGK